MPRIRYARLAIAVALIAILATAATPVLAQDWRGIGRAFGQVKDEDGNPVDGAKVQIYFREEGNGPEPVYTKKNGNFSFGGLIGGMWTVLIDAEGFKPSQGAYSVAQFVAGKGAQITLVADPFGAIDEGDTLSEAGDHAGARAAYAKALENLPPGPAARLRSRIGDTYLAEGNYEAARKEYKSALPMIEPAEQAHIRIQLATSYQQEGNSAEALAEFEKVMPLLTPDGQAQILLTMARMHDQADNRAAAIGALEKALELSPGDVALTTLIADLLGREGRDDEAAAYMAQLPEDAELPADMVLNMGIKLYNEGKLDEAYDHFDRAVSENPSLAAAYYYRGLVHLSRQNNDQARADLNKLLELEPDGQHSAEAKDFLSYLD
ncbi:MAG: tetratricopeptide repeat protein [Thermoanaerobaculia bacterium]